MGKSTNSVVGRCLIGACLMGAVGLAGSAEAQHRGFDRGHGGHVAPRSGATLIVNGERIWLGHGSIVHEIGAALRCKGYRVSVDDGCIVVHYRGHAPRLALAGCDYGLSVERSRGCVTIRPVRLDHRWDDRGHGHGHGDWRRDRERDGHWDRRRSFRWRSSPSCGFTIRIGG